MTYHCIDHLSNPHHPLLHLLRGGVGGLVGGGWGWGGVITIQDSLFTVYHKHYIVHIWLIHYTVHYTTTSTHFLVIKIQPQRPPARMNGHIAPWTSRSLTREKLHAKITQVTVSLPPTVTPLSNDDLSNQWEAAMCPVSAVSACRPMRGAGPGSRQRPGGNSRPLHQWERAIPAPGCAVADRGLSVLAGWEHIVRHIGYDGMRVLYRKTLVMTVWHTVRHWRWRCDIPFDIGDDGVTYCLTLGMTVWHTVKNVKNVDGG